MQFHCFWVISCKGSKGKKSEWWFRRKSLSKGSSLTCNVAHSARCDIWAGIPASQPPAASGSHGRRRRCYCWKPVASMTTLTSGRSPSSSTSTLNRKRLAIFWHHLVVPTSEKSAEEILRGCQMSIPKWFYQAKLIPKTASFTNKTPLSWVLLLWSEIVVFV